MPAESDDPDSGIVRSIAAARVVLDRSVATVSKAQLEVARIEIAIEKLRRVLGPLQRQTPTTQSRG